MVSTVIEEQVRQIAKALAPLLKELVDSRAMRYEGVYENGRQYTRNAIVTRSGTIWHCAANSTNATPGDNSGDWKLMVKAAR